MGKEFFSYPDTQKLFTLLEEASHRSGVSRGQAFEDFLVMSVCALSGQRMEEEYLQTVQKHTAGKPGKRGCDSISRMFGELVAAMEQDTRDEMKDILGDLFQGAITYGEAGQFLTPIPICNLMAELTINQSTADANPDPTSPLEADALPDTAKESVSPQGSPYARRTVHDPCSGSGRMLLAAARINRYWEFFGQDVDLRCVRMTALNLAFRNLYGYVIWGNTLALEQKLVYRTGFDGCGFLRQIPIELCPALVQRAAASAIADTTSVSDSGVSPSGGKGRQLELF